MAKPVLMTPRALAAGAAERWREQYLGPVGGRWIPQPEKKAIHEALVALGPSPEPADVARVIGNDSWTDPGACDGCGKKVTAAVRVGDEPDYESSTAALCRGCLREALSLLPEGDDT
jgi:hypothetical protein